MSLLDFVAIFILLDIVGIIHIFIIKKDLFAFLKISISKRLFGENKTWRGVFVMSIFSMILGAFYFNYIFAFFLGFFWILGELPNSFVKRRLGIKSGQYSRGIGVLFQYIVDTLDSVVVILIFINFLYDISFLQNISLIFAGFVNHSAIDYFCYKIGIKKLNYGNPLIIFVQIFVRLFFQIYLFFYSNYTKISLKVDDKKNYIFISNHISKLDPFLICTILDFKTISKLVPFRFMVSNSYMKKYGKLAKLFGCYPSHIGEKHTLELSKKFLERGETVFIFPEGGIHKKKFGIGAFWLNKNVIASDIGVFGIDKKKKKFQIDFLGFNNINNYKSEKDLLETGKIIFNQIEKWISKR